MKKLNAKNLFSCIVYDFDLGGDIYTVVYRIKDVYYDMRLIHNSFDLTSLGLLSNRLSYTEDKKWNSYYGTERAVLMDTLQPFYKDNREFFTIKELILDMVDDPLLDTNWPGFSTYAAHQKKLNKSISM